MSSIFNLADNAAIIARIQQLSPDSTPRWGKTTVAQMLAHCQKPIQVAYGQLALKRGLIGILFGNYAKKKILSQGKGFGKNGPTDPNFIIRETRDFETEKAALIPLVQAFAQGGPALLTNKPHPFFGNLSEEEWDALMRKHLDHHLTQFGA